MAPRMDPKDVCRPSWKAGLLISYAGVSPFWEYCAHLCSWKEVEEKEAKIIKSMESWSCEERFKGSESVSLKERRLKDDLATFCKLFFVAIEG